MISQRQIQKKYAALLKDVATNDYYKIDLTNRVNCYKCACGHITKTKDIDPGVTPFMHRCEKCGKMAHSSFYVDIAPQQKPTAELQSLMNDILEWSDKTFGDGQRNPAIVYHLKKEVNELIAVFEEKPRNAHRQLWFEYADCVMLLLDSALHAGFTARDLIDATREKLEINKTRKWGKPDANGVVEHIEPTAEGAEEMIRERFGADVFENPPYYPTFAVELQQLMETFATLYAQRLAEKMVEERCAKCEKR